MHFVHHCTICFMTSEEKVLGWKTSHACTVTSVCWSVVNRRPLKSCLSGPNRWVWRCKVKTVQGMLQYLKVYFLKGCNSVGSVCIINGCEPLAPLTDNPLWHDTVSILHWHHSMHFDTWYTFSPQKWITALALLWCKWNWECPCLWQRNSWQKWTIKVTPAPQW